MNPELPKSFESNFEIIIKNIGRKICDARKFKKVKIETVSKSLRIRGSYLLAIEGGKIEALPDYVYLKGFIKCYANYFELKINDDLNLLHEEYNKLNLRNIPRIEEKNNFSKNKFFLSLIFASLVSLIIILVIYMGYSINQNITVDSTEQVVDKTQVVKIIQESPKNVLILDENFLKDTFSEFETSNDIETQNSNSLSTKIFVVKFIDETWFQVESVDGNIIESKVFNEGETISLVIDKINPNFFIHTGNAGGFILLLNDKALPKLGTKGSVKKNISLLEYSSLAID